MQVFLCLACVGGALCGRKGSGTPTTFSFLALACSLVCVCAARVVCLCVCTFVNVLVLWQLLLAVTITVLSGSPLQRYAALWILLAALAALVSVRPYSDKLHQRVEQAFLCASVATLLLAELFVTDGVASTAWRVFAAVVRAWMCVRFAFVRVPTSAVSATVLSVCTHALRPCTLPDLLCPSSFACIHAGV